MDFGFPYEAYSIQNDLMQSLYRCFEEGGVGIFESPTGTGKSLSIICATLSWLRDHELKKRAQLEQTVHKDKNDENKADDDDWIGAYRKKLDASKVVDEAAKQLATLDKVAARLKEARTKTSDSRHRKMKRKAPNNDSADRIADEVPPLSDDDPDKDIAPVDYNSDDDAAEKRAQSAKPEEEEKLSCTKIFYCSRTHSQLEQFAQEIQKTKFLPRAVTLGSRQALCVNDAVRRLGSVQLMNERCLEMKEKGASTNKVVVMTGDDDKKKVQRTRGGVCKCEYYRSEAMEDLSDQLLSVQLTDMSQLLKWGRDNLACPYFASRISLPLCEIVLLPYQVLLHEKTRQAWGVDLSDSVVVVDEAHNLLEAIAAVYSCDVDGGQLASSQLIVQEYTQRFRARLKASNLLYVRQLLTVLAALNGLLTSYAKRKLATVFTLPQFILQLDLGDVNIFKLLNYLDKTDLCKKLHGFSMRYHTTIARTESDGNSKVKVSGVHKLLQKQTDQPVQDKQVVNEEKQQQQQRTAPSPMYHVRSFLETMTNKCEDGRVIVSADGEKPSFRFLLLNPAEKLKDVLKKARSVVLAGGTMEPSFQLTDAFTRVCQVPPERIKRFSCGHMVDDSQLLPIVLGRGASGAKLNFSFESRSTTETVSSLGMVLLNLLRLIPNGVVVFFPSYDYINFVTTRLKESGVLQKIDNVKRLICETKTTNDSTNVWGDFTKHARSDRGAVLFAVVGGKLSEGLNFSDELGRCVIMVGLPYPNRNSVELVEKMKYLDEHSERDERSGQTPGQLFYEAACMKAVNQSIGRAIRHRKDYAAIVLLDERFARPRIQSQLPAWISSRLVVHEKLPSTLVAIRDFFKNHKNATL